MASGPFQSLYSEVDGTISLAESRSPSLIHDDVWCRCSALMSEAVCVYACTFMYLSYATWRALRNQTLPGRFAHAHFNLSLTRTPTSRTLAIKATKRSTNSQATFEPTSRGRSKLSPSLQSARTLINSLYNGLKNSTPCSCGTWLYPDELQLFCIAISSTMGSRNSK